ncbi:MAG TPA: hypothetical protein V6C81_20665 [Planktothrix sp.]|jgi:hypothetical protein
MSLIRKYIEKLQGLGRKPLTRARAADLIDEFAEMKWTYSDKFDLAFFDSTLMNDPLLEEVAKEFREIQGDYENNVRNNEGALSAENLTRLRSLSARLRS